MAVPHLRITPKVGESYTTPVDATAGHRPSTPTSTVSVTPWTVASTGSTPRCGDPLRHELSGPHAAVWSRRSTSGSK
jgi:hypothetical protein